MAEKYSSDAGRLYRSGKNKMLSGVCGGLGEYFGLDPVIFRVLFLGTFFYGSWFLYLIAWILIPGEKA